MKNLQLKLQFRAECIRSIREFFYQKNYCEVETPIARSEVIIDAHISPWQVVSKNQNKKLYLHTSPEMNHKRLLAAGMSSLYEIAHVFRSDEYGTRHHPEFLMLEWYGVNTSLDDQMLLTEELVNKVFKVAEVWKQKHGMVLNNSRVQIPIKRISYHDLFYSAFKINPHTASVEELQRIVRELSLPEPRGMNDVDDWLNLLLTEYLEAMYLTDEPVFLVDYPITQAALARIVTDQYGNQVARRFELYVRGVELCNAYHEQHDPVELKSRMEYQNQQRLKQHENPIPYCQNLITEMQKYFPDCSGVALGLDRLLMLAGGFSTLDDVVAFPSDT